MIISRSNKIKIAQIAKERGLTYSDVESVIKSPFEFIREVTANLKMSRTLNSDELTKLKTNFNIPCIGKLYLNHYQYRVINKLNVKKGNKNI